MDATQRIPVTTTRNGLMLATDKAKLDSITVATWLVASNNLGDVVNPGTARTNLGLGSISTHGASEYELAGVAASLISALGLGSASTHAASDFALSTTTISVSGTGLSGGGSLASNRTITFDQTAITVTESQVTSLVTDLAARALTATTISVSGTGLTGGGSLAANRTITFDQTAITVTESQVTSLVSDLAAKAATATTISVAGTGLTGGGSLAANRTITFDQTAITVTESQVTSLVTDLAAKAATSTTISTSGTGLSGGGSLAANRTITFDQTAITITESQVTSLTTDLALWKGGILVIRKGQVITSYAPADTNAARGASLVTALAAAVSGDEVELGPGTFDVSASGHFLTIPAGVVVRGAGMDCTTITSTVTTTVDNRATYELANGSKVEDLYLDGGNKSITQALVGTLGAGAANVTCYLTRVRVNGGSDCVYIWSNSTNFRIICYDCVLESAYDAVAVLGTNSSSGFIVDLHECEITCTAHYLGADQVATAINCVNCTGGLVRLYDCLLTGRGDSSTLIASGVTCGANGTVEVTNCTFDITTTSGVAYDLNFTGAGATIKTNDGCRGSGTGGRLTTTNSTTGMQTHLSSKLSPIVFTLFPAGTIVVTTSGDNSVRIPIPRSMNGKQLRYVRLWTPTVGATGLTSVQLVRERGGISDNGGTGVDMLSTVISLDSAEASSDTAATPAVINRSNNTLASYDYIRADVTAVSTTPPVGLFLEVEFD